MAKSYGYDMSDPDAANSEIFDAFMDGKRGIYQRIAKIIKRNKVKTRDLPQVWWALRHPIYYDDKFTTEDINEVKRELKKLGWPPKKVKR